MAVDKPSLDKLSPSQLVTIAQEESKRTSDRMKTFYQKGKEQGKTYRGRRQSAEEFAAHSPEGTSRFSSCSLCEGIEVPSRVDASD